MPSESAIRAAFGSWERALERADAPASGGP
jgi:hypothetical protein